MIIAQETLFDEEGQEREIEVDEMPLDEENNHNNHNNNHQPRL